MIYGTIEEEVEAGKELTRAHRLFNRTAIIHYTKSGESIKIPMNALVSDFRDLLDEYIIRLDLTEEGQAFILRSLWNDSVLVDSITLKWCTFGD